jgi:hypothetical protein
MHLKKFLIILNLTGFLTILSCTKPLPEVEANIVNPETYFDIDSINSHPSTLIEFISGGSMLNKKSKASINSMFNKIYPWQDASDIIVLSWPDQDPPTTINNKLSRSQALLTEKRNISVKNYLNKIQELDVETFNMATNPATLSNWIDTTDTKLKNSFSAAGLSTTAASAQYSNKASHSLIILRTNEFE